MRKRSPQATHDAGEQPAKRGDAEHDPQPRSSRLRLRQRPGTSPPPHPDDVVALVFSLNVEVLLDHAEERGVAVPSTTRMHAARTLQLHWNENRSIIARKQRAFTIACLALAAQTLGWIIFIALGREAI